jgi:hypothetical protein
MEWTAWNNGSFHSSGAGYGFKVPIDDRDRFFERSWGSVVVELPLNNEFIEVIMNCPAASRGVSELKQLELLVMKRAIFRAHFFGEHHFPIFGRTCNMI